MKKKNKKRLDELWLEYSRKEWPNVPDHCRPGFPYKDNSTNGLTKCVIKFIELSGWQAERISSTGRYIDNSTTFTDVVGFKRQIGRGKYIKGTGTNGTSDIKAVIHGRSISIEIKYGKDRQSEAQKKYQESIERAGGIYIIIKDFDSFLEWYDGFILKY